ncbi:zinc-binding dehydrogenase [Actinoplanes sp. NBRC 103695]|uniref:zinc-binding dehydrogenase n=1 Tax=Actinoplanes sp. NBRC 103695 TaxID=3032202 RepID=UPI0025543E90|nr:zinc-binding dehydrogenase [Actinoplanes sp. NBRC 103695]
MRSSKLTAPATTKLPYDRIVDSAELPDSLDGERFDVIVGPVGSDVRTRSLDLLAAGGRLLVVGNASGDWTHQMGSNQLWLGNATVSGFNAGAFVPAHPQLVCPAIEAALRAVAAGLSDTEVDVLPFAEAAAAHKRMESRALDGRIVLTPGARGRTNRVHSRRRPLASSPGRSARISSAMARIAFTRRRRGTSTRAQTNMITMATIGAQTTRTTAHGPPVSSGSKKGPIPSRLSTPLVEKGTGLSPTSPELGEAESDCDRGLRYYGLPATIDRLVPVDS